MRGARDAETIDIAKEIKDIAPEALELLKDQLFKSEEEFINTVQGKIGEENTSSYKSVILEQSKLDGIYFNSGEFYVSLGEKKTINFMACN